MGQIILDDDYVFLTEGQSEVRPLTRPKTFNDSINGYLITTRSLAVRWRYRYNLIVNDEQLGQLQTLFATLTSRINFIDHKGFSWLVGAGTDDATHAYNTGAEFENEVLDYSKANPKNDEACGQSYSVPVVIIVNARGLVGAAP